MNQQQDELELLLSDLRQLGTEARGLALRAVDVIQVQTCRQVGRHLMELEQKGSLRADHGERLVSVVSEQLIAELCYIQN